MIYKWSIYHLESPREVVAELKKAMTEIEDKKDKEISDYLKKHPIKDGIGKFGVPQDKYRWGFYGSSSMEYDIWRKGDKS